LKIPSHSLIAISFIFTANAYAVEPTSEPIAKFYYSIPLGHSSQKYLTPRFGFQLDYTNRFTGKNNVGASFQSRKPLLQMQFNQRGFQNMQLYGLNVAERKLIYNIDDGTSTATTDINWGVVLAGVALGGAIIVTKDVAESIADKVEEIPADIIEDLLDGNNDN